MTRKLFKNVFRWPGAAFTKVLMRMARLCFLWHWPAKKIALKNS